MCAAVANGSDATILCLFILTASSQSADLRVTPASPLTAAAHKGDPNQRTVIDASSDQSFDEERALSRARLLEDFAGIIQQAEMPTIDIDPLLAASH